MTSDNLGPAAPNDLNATWAITPDVSSFAEKLMSKYDVPGISVGVVRLTEAGNAQTDFGAWGRATENGEAPTETTLFSIGSCSKAFLASALGILMDDFAQGRNIVPLPGNIHNFSWDTKIRDLLPDQQWALADPWASANASVHDILGHMSGLAGHDLFYSDGDDSLDIISRLRHLKPTYELRERYSYTNHMYIVGAYIVSIYSGMPYTQFVKERIFSPLRMDATTFSSEEAEHTGRLSHSWTRDGRRIPFWFKPAWTEVIAAAGGIISSSSDMVKWIATLLNKGADVQTGAIIIPSSAFDETTTAQCIVQGKGPDAHTSLQGYGMGWQRMTYQGHEVVCHAGGIPGFSSMVLFLPSSNIGVVVLANTNGSEDVPAAMATRIIENVLGLQHASDKLLLPPTTADTAGQQTEAGSVEATSVPLEAYAGTYTNPAYGTLTFYAPSTDSIAGQQVIAEYAKCCEIAENGQALYASWNRIWSSYNRLRHHTKDVFLWSHAYLFPHGCGQDETPFAYKMLGDVEVPVEFSVYDGKVIGFGVLDVVFDPRREPCTDGDVEQRADVWFEKVE